MKTLHFDGSFGDSSKFGSQPSLVVLPVYQKIGSCFLGNRAPYSFIRTPPGWSSSTFAPDEELADLSVGCRTLPSHYALIRRQSNATGASAVLSSAVQVGKL